MHLFYNPEATSKILPLEESQHAIRVLRLNQGDPIEITDGTGSFYHATLTNADSRATTYHITKQIKIPARPCYIHLAIAPTKSIDRMEWMVEKCTEVGVDKISFLLCKTSERKTLKLDRLTKISINAMKQSGQAWLPELSDLVAFPNFIEQTTTKSRFIAHVDATNPVHLHNLTKPRMDAVILVGPEGDFTTDELQLAIDNNYKKVSLGHNRLRTETAGLYAVAILNLACVE